MMHVSRSIQLGWSYVSQELFSGELLSVLDSEVRSQLPHFRNRHPKGAAEGCVRHPQSISALAGIGTELLTSRWYSSTSTARQFQVSHHGPTPNKTPKAGI